MFTNIPQIFSVGIIKSKSVSGSSKVCMIYRWRVLVFTVAITCYNSSYCQKNDILSPILIGSLSLMRVFVLVSFSAEFQDKRQIVKNELEARLALQRQAVSGREIPTKGIARSLSDMISVAEPSDSENDSSEGEFCLFNTTRKKR